MEKLEQNALPIHIIPRNERVFLDGELVEIVNSDNQEIKVKSINSAGQVYGKSKRVDHNKLVTVLINEPL